MGDIKLQVGDVEITRVEESYEPAFPVDVLLPAFSDDVVDDHGGKAEFDAYMTDDGLAKLSVHTWLARTPRSVILIDTGCGNHKDRPAMPVMHQLDLPFLERLAEAGVQPEDVDHVVCTHIHLDHVGWNTRLVDGEWVPTFPNATYHFNRTEFEFWDPRNPANAPLEFNAGVFADSVQPVFDRELVSLWDGDLDLDEVFHLEMAVGHTPGHAIAWLESKGERALFSADAMHSPIQVYEPKLNCGFDLDGDGAFSARRSVLEACAEKGAVLLPAHFSAPHAFRLEARGGGLVPVSAV